MAGKPLRRGLRDGLFGEKLRTAVHRAPRPGFRGTASSSLIGTCSPCTAMLLRWTNLVTPAASAALAMAAVPSTVDPNAACGGQSVPTAQWTTASHPAVARAMSSADRMSPSVTSSGRRARRAALLGRRTRGRYLPDDHWHGGARPPGHRRSPPAPVAGPRGRLPVTIAGAHCERRRRQPALGPWLLQRFCRGVARVDQPHCRKNRTTGEHGLLARADRAKPVVELTAEGRVAEQALLIFPARSQGERATFGGNLVKRGRVLRVDAKRAEVAAQQLQRAALALDSDCPSQLSRSAELQPDGNVAPPGGNDEPHVAVGLDASASIVPVVRGAAVRRAGRNSV